MLAFFFLPPDFFRGKGFKIGPLLRHSSHRVWVPVYCVIKFGQVTHSVQWPGKRVPPCGGSGVGFSILPISIRADFLETQFAQVLNPVDCVYKILLVFVNTTNVIIGTPPTGSMGRGGPGEGVASR